MRDEFTLPVIPLETWKSSDKFGVSGIAGDLSGLVRPRFDGLTKTQTSLKPQFSVEEKPRFNSPTIAG
jgi:hypothetical protein